MDTYGVRAIVRDRRVDLKCTENTLDEVHMIHIGRGIGFDGNDETINPTETNDDVLQFVLSCSARRHRRLVFVFGFSYFHIAKLHGEDKLGCVSSINRQVFAHLNGVVAITQAVDVHVGGDLIGKIVLTVDDGEFHFCFVLVNQCALIRCEKVSYAGQSKETC